MNIVIVIEVENTLGIEMQILSNKFSLVNIYYTFIFAKINATSNIFYVRLKNLH